MTPRTHASHPARPLRPLPAHLTRALATGIVAGLTAATLTGCLISYDAAKPEIAYRNEYAEPVIVVIERGPDGEVRTDVGSRSGASFALNECTGTAMRVESEEGDVLARIEEAACPNWDLTFNADGTLDYSER